MTKLEGTLNWMTQDERNVLAEAAGNLMERSADDFQLAVEALLAIQQIRQAAARLTAREEIERINGLAREDAV